MFFFNNLKQIYVLLLITQTRTHALTHTRTHAHTLYILNIVVVGGYGAWSTDGCELVGYPTETIVKFRCNHLSSFALLVV